MGREQVVVVLIDRQIVEALARRAREVELGDLAQRRAGCFTAGDAGSSCDGDRRNVDARKDVVPSAQDHERAQHENQERQENERIGAGARDSDDPHVSAHPGVDQHVISRF